VGYTISFTVESRLTESMFSILSTQDTVTPVLSSTSTTSLHSDAQWLVKLYGL
jgi:hypothetical protein